MNSTIFDNENNDDASFSTGKDDYAVALGYEQNKDNAPIVLAKGAGEIAQKLLKLLKKTELKLGKMLTCCRY